jgi:hypothetical protein
MNSQKRTITVRRLDDQAAELSNRELLGRILSESSELVRREVALARTELIADLSAEVKVAKTVGAGAVLALCGLNLALVAIVLAIAPLVVNHVSSWALAAIGAVVLLATAGVFTVVGWQRRVKQPLHRTRKHLHEDVTFMKERLA